MDVLDDLNILSDKQQPDEYPNHYINDKREDAEFRNITFSGYKKTACKKSFVASLNGSSLEESLHWCTEFICAGHYLDIWETIILMVSRNIHIGNPKLPIYIANKYSAFRDAIYPYVSSGDLLSSRNDPTIRGIFCELICIICLSKKKQPINGIHLNKTSCFELPSISYNSKAPSTKYTINIIQEDDPREICIAANEFAFNISNDSNNMITACYWIEWMIAIGTRYKQMKTPLECSIREFIPTDDKFKKEPICIVWEIILNEVKERKDRLSETIIQSLLNLFYIRYTSGATSRRKFLLYFAVSILTDVYSSKIPIVAVEYKDFVSNIPDIMNHQYSEIKKNEYAPETNYLDHKLNHKLSDTDKMLKQLAQLENADVPRNIID